ncbi:MAG: UvrB/UvrC motif-containing protein [Candidatus Geothermincolia bacterium]
MYCEECQKNPATVFMNQVENNILVKKRLCEDCARQLLLPGHTVDLLAMMPQLLAGAMEPGLDVTFPEDLRQDMVLCLNCGTTLTDLRETGRLGCEECFEAFAQPLSDILPAVQKSIMHCGKTPASCPPEVLIRRELLDLRSRLEQLVAREDFEVAAEIRDQIKTLENRLSGEEADGLV